MFCPWVATSKDILIIYEADMHGPGPDGRIRMHGLSRTNGMKMMDYHTVKSLLPDGSVDVVFVPKTPKLPRYVGLDLICTCPDCGEEYLQKPLQEDPEELLYAVHPSVARVVLAACAWSSALGPDVPPRSISKEGQELHDSVLGLAPQPRRRRGQVWMTPGGSYKNKETGLVVKVVGVIGTHYTNSGNWCGPATEVTLQEPFYGFSHTVPADLFLEKYEQTLDVTSPYFQAAAGKVIRILALEEALEREYLQVKEEFADAAKVLDEAGITEVSLRHVPEAKCYGIKKVDEHWTFIYLLLGDLREDPDHVSFACRMWQLYSRKEKILQRQEKLRSLWSEILEERE
jgi:hypothetical protein